MTDGTPTAYEPPADGGGGPGRSGGRTRSRRPLPLRLLPLAVAGWAVLEIWLLLLVGEAAGGLTVVALLVAGFVLGAVVIKRAGRRAWQRLAEGLQQGDPAAAEQSSRSGGSALAMLGGLLLMVPGLVSDGLGLLCLFPPTASLLRRGAARLLTRGDLGVAVRQARAAGEQARIHRPDGRIVEGEVLRDDEPPER